MPVKVQAIRSKKVDWVKLGEAKLEAVLTTFGAVALASLQSYPPPNSPYVRTYKLRDSWSVDRGKHSVIVRNSAPYSSYVQGPRGKSGRSGGQTAVMAGKGWTSVTDAKKEAAAAAIAAAAGSKVISAAFGSTVPGRWARPRRR